MDLQSARDARVSGGGMNRRWVMTMGLLCTVASGARPGYAQVRGTIFGPGARNYPVAIAPLKNEGGSTGKDLGTRFADIIGRDLTLAGYFKVLDRNAYIEKSDSGYTADSINFDNWSVIGALALVAGGYRLEGDTLTIEVRLFDVYQRRQLTGRRYHGSVDDLRRMANRFADEIMQQFTGERGPFDARLAFVSTRDGRFKELYTMSVDGGDLQQLTRNQTI